MNMLKITSSRLVLFVLCLLLGIGTGAFGQTSSLISVRFANPHYDVQANTYTLDVEMKAIGSPQQLFGMNVRFFYDASELEFLSLEALHPSYSLLGGSPNVFKGNSASGPEMFSFEESAAYVNGAVQLTKENAPLTIEKNKWTKVFEARFNVPASIPDGTMLCPSLTWDLKAYAQEEGFFPAITEYD
ncbi:MAG: hypothetical protein IPL49_17340 [Saprospirales bacterium]|nr:hypothetical protein [Saprospirales bacterium]